MVFGNAQLELEISEEREALMIRLRGQFLDPCEMPTLPAHRAGLIVFELKDLERMSSIGVRQWDQWMREIAKSAPGATIELRGMPAFFVDLFNLIHEFVPEPYRIESFFRPCYCEKCEVSSETLISSGSGPLPRRIEQLPSIPCEMCGHRLTVDVVSDRYFQFMRKSI